MIINELLTAVFQIIVFSIVPVLFWFFADRKKESFFSWIGIKKPVVKDSKTFYSTIIAAVLVAVLIPLALMPMLPEDIQFVNEKFDGQGIKALIPAFVFSFFTTGLAEEVLFRGFLGKRLSAKLGFYAGNTIQALIFGLIHGATMFSIYNIIVPLVIIIFTGAFGWLMGYINEKASGSILPGWCLHGLINLFAAVM